MDKKNKANILIVDDVEVNRTILENIIVSMDLQPILAENGAQALELVRQCRPQLILLDVSMPQMDGYELCRILKETPEYRDIPIIFISAYDEPKNITTGFDLGCEDYIIKPFIPEVVRARVGTHLKLSNTVQQLAETNRRLQVSVNEQLAQMEEEKKRVLHALVRVARQNVHYEEAYMERLCYNCKIFSRALQLSPKYESQVSDSFVETIAIVAPLCDLGNMAIPDVILSKKGRLNPIEQMLFETHTTAGADILKDIMAGDYNDYIQMAIDIANFHHENWDGTGYPCGISEDEIPLSAQIVSVMSEFCALTGQSESHRTYTKGEALLVMQGEAGVKFNETLFDICKKIAHQLH